MQVGHMSPSINRPPWPDMTPSKTIRLNSDARMNVVARVGGRRRAAIPSGADRFRGRVQTGGAAIDGRSHAQRTMPQLTVLPVAAPAC